MNTKNQEILIYHAQYIKALDNLSNLNPSSCILANARKLTNVEIHSTELYNINVTNNTFLRSINLEGCSALGTVTATGSSLDLSNCKYLRYCNVYNTALTEVQLDTSGGSLIEILYPKTIQSINLIKQRLLEKIGLPYGSGGEEIPTSLYTISIQECPSIKYLNTSDNSAINTSFASMVYCNNLTIRNSLDLRRLTFDGFYRLKKVVIENMYNLEELGFNDLLPKGDASTLQYIGLSNCPLLEVLELNCTSNEYEITFANKAILNLGGLFGLKSIQSNCVLKGIETIVVPLNLESMFFTNEYGEGYSTIKNIWSSSVCTVNTSGSTAKAQHVDPTYEGIDFAGMNLKNIDLGALVNIPKAINFTLHPTTVNPHFNLNRDGETYPYLQPVGTLDLSNYTESLAKFFDGVDLDKLKIVCNNELPQTDLSYCFYNATFSNDTAINALLSKVSSITNLDYCFYKTAVADTSILRKISMGESSTMNYTFAECPNITNLKNVIIPSTVMEIEGLFYKCPNLTNDFIIPSTITDCSKCFNGCTKITHIRSNWNNSYANEITSTDCYAGCTGITHIDNENVIAYEGDCGLDYIPILWGGRGFEADVTSIMEVTATTDNFVWRPCSDMKLFTLKPVSYISWGDGTNTAVTTFSGAVPTHTYAKAGVYIVKSHSTFGNGLSVNGTGMTKLLNIACRDRNLTTGKTVNRTNTTWGLNGAWDLVYADVSNFFKHGVKLSGIIKMFQNCPKLTTIVGIEDLDTSNCASTESMFEGCRSLTSLDLSKWNLQKMESFYGMFLGCTNLVSVKMSKDTPNLKNTQQMFRSCKALVEAPQFDTSKVISFGGNERGMFQQCYALTSVPVYDFSSAVYVSRMFRDCRSLRSFKCINCSSNIPYYNDGYDDWSSMFAGCHELISIEGLNFEGLDYTVNHKGELSASGTIAYNCPKLTTFTVKEGTKIKVIDTSTNQYLGFNLRVCNALSKTSLLNIINALEDYSGDSVRTLDIGSTNIAKLSESDIQIVTSKNWTLI